MEDEISSIGLFGNTVYRLHNLIPEFTKYLTSEFFLTVNVITIETIITIITIETIVITLTVRKNSDALGTASMLGPFSKLNIVSVEN
jgi:hypothetical protein